MTVDASRQLRRLQKLRTVFTADSRIEKLGLMRSLERARLGSAKEVHALHESLCFARAYPDDASVLACAESMLAAFSRRGDLRRHRRELEGTGIAGTTIPYRFYFTTARWLASRWPQRLRIEWAENDTQDRLKSALPALVTPTEAAAFRESRRPVRELVDRLRASDEADGSALARHVAQLTISEALREALHDGIDTAYLLEPGERPSRTNAFHRTGAVVDYQTGPLSKDRPDLRDAIRRPPCSIRAVAEDEGATLVDLAREAMVTRARDLDAFAYGNPSDVSLLDDGHGLAFASIGTVLERRHLIRGAYGLLALKNGVPLGYIQMDAALGRAEVSFNIFPTFRGAEAKALFSRTLAAAHHLYGARTFSIEPYQLGHGNREAIDSGAWWFYYKLGFRPREAELLELADAELKKMKHDRAHRSSRATLKRLSARHLYFALDRRQRPQPPPFLGVSRAVSEMIRERFDGDRKRALRRSPTQALARLGLRSFDAKTADERQAVSRLSPVVLCIDDVESWSTADKRAVATVVRAKGAAREQVFLDALAKHKRLADALMRLGRAYT